MSTIIIITPPKVPQRAVVETDAGAEIHQDGQIVAQFTSYEAAIKYLKVMKG